MTPIDEGRIGERAVAVHAVECRDCPLRTLNLFLTHSSEELQLVQSLKRGHVRVGADQTLIHEGQTDAPLYTLYSGWAFRYKTLCDGRRQILSFLMAGDFIGVQQKMGDAAAHGVDTLTDASLCVFQRDALWELHRRSPTMGFNITWLTAHEESLVDDTLLSVGRRSAEVRIAREDRVGSDATHFHFPDYLLRPPMAEGRASSIQDWMSEPDWSSPAYFYLGMRCYADFRDEGTPPPQGTHEQPACRKMRERFARGQFAMLCPNLAIEQLAETIDNTPRFGQMARQRVEPGQMLVTQRPEAGAGAGVDASHAPLPLQGEVKLRGGDEQAGEAEARDGEEGRAPAAVAGQLQAGRDAQHRGHRPAQEDGGDGPPHAAAAATCGRWPRPPAG